MIEKQKYIISIDLGSTYYKYVIIRIEQDNLVLVDKNKFDTIGFDKCINNIIDKYNISKPEIEKLVITGTGASFVEANDYSDLSILKISEFDAIGYGGLILAKMEKAIIVSIGTGTAFVYTDMNKNTHIGGTGLGGGTLIGLCKLLIKDKNFDVKHFNIKNLIDMAKNGDSKNVDLKIGDISKNSINNLTYDITASNFAATEKTFNNNDVVSGIINMILENISLLAVLHAKNLNNENIPIVFIGNVLSDDYIKNCLVKINKFTGGNFVFVDNAEYAVAIGAYEYYLLRNRKIE